MHSTGEEASLLSPAPSSEQLEVLDADFFAADVFRRLPYQPERFSRLEGPVCCPV